MRHTFDTTVTVPVLRLKKKTSFHICYESSGVMHSLIKCWYDKDFFFYPNVKNYDVSFCGKGGEKSTVSEDSEKKHPRITFHPSGVVVGPDKHERPKSQKYEKLKKRIRDCRNGISLAVHALAHPGHYAEITEKSYKKGNWFAFNVENGELQPVITIDAYPIFDDSEVEEIFLKKITSVVL